jgi:O-antigen/teichoic acid export membrane protein
VASLKKLAGQTVWYGLSNIVAKLLNQLLTPLITWLLNSPAQVASYGDFGILFSYISFFNVIYTYGMETAYFRFSSLKEDADTLYQTACSSIIVSTVVLSGLLMAFAAPIASFVGIANHPEYVSWCILILACDTLAAIPFARLRQEGRPKKYAFVRVAGIMVNMLLTVVFLVASPGYVAANPTATYAAWYKQNDPAGFLILANVFASFATLLLLYGEWRVFRFRFSKALWRRMLVYSGPMLVIGLGGMINETFDRTLLGRFFNGTHQEAKIAVGIYNANYKLAIFITLFITAFRFSAEPFFFSQSLEKNAPQTYARVMKWFVIVLCCAFLFTALFLDIWQYYLGAAYRGGLGVVPILLAANVWLGIYYNLSVWYKITNKMYMGVIVTLIGAAITLVVNVLFIPVFGMYACAWATFLAYFFMMVASYLLGRKHFPVPYSVRKLLAYLGVAGLLFFAQQLVISVTSMLPSPALTISMRVFAACFLMYLFLRLVVSAERTELAKLPFVSKLVK